MSYVRDLGTTSSQKKILHHVSGATGSPPKDLVPDSYASWSTGDYTPWLQIEDALRATDAIAYSRARADDIFEEEEEEDILGEEGESEDTAGEASKESAEDNI